MEEELFETTKNKNKLGVIFVHGIGEQNPGETLSEWADSLIYWLTYSKTGKGTKRFEEVIIGETYFEKDHNNSETPSYTELKLKLNSFLKPFFTKTNWDVDEARSRWLLAEAFWADTVLTPKFIELLQWNFKILPGTLLSHFSRLTYRICVQKESLFRNAENLNVIYVAFMFLVMGVITLPILIVVYVIFVLVLMLGIAPIPAIRNVSASIQRLLAASIGDSLVLMNSPIQKAAILDRVNKAYSFLDKNECDEIVIIAHSQGAAVAHEFVNKRVCPKVKLLITFGSGLHKLKAIEKEQEKRGSGLWFSALSLIAIVPLFYAFFQTVGINAICITGSYLLLGTCITVVTLLLLRRSAKRIAQDVPAHPVGILRGIKLSLQVLAGLALSRMFLSLIGGVIYFLSAIGLNFWLLPEKNFINVSLALTIAFLFYKVAYGIYGNTVSAVYSGIKSARTPTLNLEYRVPSHVERWVDIYSSSDPVSNGPLQDDLTKKDREFESIKIENRNSIIFDHTTYWANIEQFVAKVGQELIGAAKYDIKSIANNDDLSAFSQERTNRLDVLKKSRSLVVLLTIWLVTTSWESLFSYAERIQPSLVPKIEKIPLIGDFIEKLLSTNSNTFAVWLLSGILLMIGWFIASAILEMLWAVWDRSVAQKMASKLSYETLHTESIFYLYVISLFATTLVIFLKSV